MRRKIGAHLPPTRFLVPPRYVVEGLLSVAFSPARKRTSQTLYPSQTWAASSWIHYRLVGIEDPAELTRVRMNLHSSSDCVSIPVAPVVDPCWGRRPILPGLSDQAMIRGPSSVDAREDPGSLTTKQRVKSQHALGLLSRFGGGGSTSDANNSATSQRGFTSSMWHTCHITMGPVPDVASFDV